MSVQSVGVQSVHPIQLTSVQSMGVQSVQLISVQPVGVQSVQVVDGQQHGPITDRFMDQFLDRFRIDLSELDE